MNGFSDRLINGYTDAIADSENVHFSVSDQASIAEAMSEVCEMQISKSAYLLLMKISSLIVLSFFSNSC
jgi:uncharacterized protein YciW